MGQMRNAADGIAPDYAGAALTRLEAATAAVSDAFAGAGFAPIEPAILQPAEFLFHLYGEEIWERAFVVEDVGGGALCLRPDFTVPAVRAHLAQSGARPARLRYVGPVFRRASEDRGGPLQHLQAGGEILGESLGEADDAARDAEIFALSMAALTAAGCAGVEAVTGDLAIAFALLEAVQMPESWRRRLKRHFWRPERFQQLLRSFAGEGAEAAAGRLAFLKGFGALERAEASAAVAEMMALTDLPQIGVRSTREVAERFLRQAEDARGHPLSPEIVTLLEAALAVDAPSPTALAELRSLLSGAGVDLAPQLEAMERRLAALADQGVDVESLRFDVSFGRNLEYYDGFNFEMTAPGAEGETLKLGGGGRYGQLFQAMGVTDALTGVGAALRPEAMTAAATAGGAS